MNLLYLNNELAVADGCNAHALGMLNAMKRIIGEENIYTFPHPQDCSGIVDNKSVSRVKEKLAPVLQVVRYYHKTIKSMTLANRLYADMEKEGFKPTHILVRSSVFERTAVILAKRTGAKLICEMNTPFYYEWCVIRKLPMRKKVEKWEKKLLNDTDYIYTVSETLKSMYMEHYKIPGEKVIVIPNGFDSELYANRDNDYEKIRTEIRKKEKLENKFVVTFIGSLKIWHGIDKFCLVADSFKNNPNIHFMVLGDGEMRELITKYVSEHTNMTFAGKLDYQTMRNYIYASDLGVMPYAIGDNFYFSPLKMYDMIGGRLPFIGSNIGQVSDICNEHLTRDFLVEDDRPETLAQAIQEIAVDKGKYAHMQEILNGSYLSFTWDCMAKKLLNALGISV